MGASITLAGESLIAQKQASKQTVNVTRFILANVPGLDTAKPVDRAAGLPPAEQIVFTDAVEHVGYMDSNRVVYSLLMTSSQGDFDFNYIGLETAEGVLLIAVYLPLLAKRREIPPFQAGNNLTRNIVLEYNGAQALTGIEVPAKTWQFDYSVLFAKVDQRLAAIETELDKKLDLDNWTPPAAVSLDGPVLVYPGTTNSYTITDYNRFSTFSATTTLGTVAIADGVVTLTIPTVAAQGMVDLVIDRDGNKAEFAIPVGSASIVAPTITSPANGVSGVSLDATFTASRFTVYPTNYDVQVSRRWQIATDAAFTQLLFDRTSTTDLLSIRPSDYDVLLPPGKKLYARAIDIGESLQSESVTVSFNTATVYIRRPSIVSPVDGQTLVSRSTTIRSDAFSVSGGTDEHAQSRFQVLDIDSGQVLQDSGWVSTPLLSYKPATDLAGDTSYDTRVKYRGSALGETEWSPLVRFRTAALLKGTYSTLAGGATARIRHAAASLGGLFYIVGGQASGNGMADFWCYDPQTNAWTQKASLPGPRYGHTLTAINGKLYCYGGQEYNRSPYKPLGLLYSYDPATDKWTARATGTPSAFHAATTSGGLLYVYGGTGDGINLKTLRVYDPATNRWAAMTSTGGPEERFESVLVAVGDYLYVFGGYKPGVPSNDLWAYSLVESTWEARAIKPSARTDHLACEYNGRLYVLGGAEDVAASKPLADAWMYDPELNEWLQQPYMPTARAAAAAAVVGDAIFIHGGNIPSYTMTNSMIKMV